MFKQYGLLIALGAGAALVLVYSAKKGVTAAAKAINPVNHDNVIAQSVNSVGTALTGDTGWTLGGQFWDWMHPSQASAQAYTAVTGVKP